MRGEAVSLLENSRATAFFSAAVAIVKLAAQGWNVSEENLLERKLSEGHVVIAKHVYPIGDLPAGQKKVIKFEPNQGLSVKAFVRLHGAQFFQAVQSRRGNFGNSQIPFNVPLGSMAASFVSELNEDNDHQSSFISPEGLDLASSAEQGNVILLAWDSGHLFTNPLNKFTPRRSHRDTLLRLVVPKAILSSP